MKTKRNKVSTDSLKERFDIRYQELIEALFRKQLKIVKNEYPNINVRTLDGVIWLYMSNKK